MGYTIAEKILLEHSGGKTIAPGDFIIAGVDLALGNDITAPIAIREFGTSGAKQIFNKNKIALIPDHFTPNKDMKSANQCKVLRNFALKHRIKHYYEVGRMGVEQQMVSLWSNALSGTDSKL